ncbi:unnamed protein product, partial [Rotaria magnacalcarata]
MVSGITIAFQRSITI